MTRPVRGYLTRDGKYFTTKKLADTYETTLDFHTTVRNYKLLADLDQPTVDYILTEVVTFMKTHKSLIQRLLKIIDTTDLTNLPREKNEMAPTRRRMPKTKSITKTKQSVESTQK